MELPVPSAAGCPWWIPVDEVKEVQDVVIANENVEVQVEKATDIPPSQEGEGGLSAAGEKDIPDAVALMFPQQKKKKR